jgi:hypothetical protein
MVTQSWIFLKVILGFLADQARFTPVRATKEENKPDGTVKPPQGKACYIQNWQKNPKTLDYCQKEIKAKRATGYGLILGNGIVAIDFDGPTSTNIAGAIGSWLMEAVNNTLAWSSGKADGYYQVAFLIPENHLKRWEKITKKDFKEYGGVKGENGDHLEIRYNSTQSVLPPSWHSGDLYYQWINESEIATLTEEQSLDLLNACNPPVEQPPQINNTQKAQNTKSNPVKSSRYEEFLAGFLLPINESVPLEICLAPDTKNKLMGVTEGSRNNSGIAIAKDLIGTTNYLNSINQAFEGDPYSLLSEYCSNCNPPLSGKDCERLYKSAEKSNPRPSLDDNKIFGCIAAWYWKENNLSTNNLSVNKKELERTYRLSSEDISENNIIQLTQQLVETLAKADVPPENRDLQIAVFCNQHKVSERAIRKAIESKLDADYKNIELESLSSYLDDLINVPKKQLDLNYIFGDFLGICITEQAKKLPTNPDALVLSLFSVIASLIGTRSKIIINPANKHSVPFIIRLCLVAESGKGKTPTIKVATDSLNRLYNSIYRQYKRELLAWEELPKEEQAKQPKPVFKKIIVKDITFEGLFKALQHNNGSCLLLRDELIGYYNALTNYGKTQGDATQRDLELFQGDSISVTRSDGDREVFIERTAVSFLGGMQPIMVSELFNRKHDEAGTSVRLTFYCGEFPDHVLMSRADNDNSFFDITDILVDVLYNKADYSDLLIDDSAYDVLMNWYNNQIVPNRALQILDKEKSKHSKTLDEAVKYAGILHFIFLLFSEEMISNPCVINKATMERAIYIADFTLANYLYLSVYSQDDALPAHLIKILKLLEAKGEITANEAYHNNKSVWHKLNMNTTAIGELLLQLVDMGKAIKVPTKKGVRIKIKK